MDFAKPNCGNSNDGHIQGVKKTITLNKHISGDARYNDNEQHENCPSDPLISDKIFQRLSN